MDNDEEKSQLDLVLYFSKFDLTDKDNNLCL